MLPSRAGGGNTRAAPAEQRNTGLQIPDGGGRGAKGMRHHAGEACAFIMITSAAVVVMSWRSSGWHWH